MSEHSKEPWSYDGDLDEVSNSDGLIGDIVGIWGPANMERAVACVNALAGLKPEHLGELVEAAEALVASSYHTHVRASFCRECRERRDLLHTSDCRVGQLATLLAKVKT